MVINLKYINNTYKLQRHDIIDPAMLRPGRLGKKLFVPFPNEVDR